MTYAHWRSLLRSGLSEQELLASMPQIAGGAGETTTTFDGGRRQGILPGTEKAPTS